MNRPAVETAMKPEAVAESNGTKISGAHFSPIKALRVGIVGAGLMGGWHARAARKAGGKIVAVADTDQERSARLASNYPAAGIFGSVERMLDRQSLDILHVCTPTASHRRIIEIALAAGVNVFVEKPLAETAAETIRLYDLAGRRSAQICPAHQFAFQRGVEKSKRLMPQMGQTVHLRAFVCSAGGANLDDEGLDRIAADILPHPLSLFQTVLDNLLPEENWQAFRPRPGELRIFGQARETTLSIFVSMNARPTSNSFQIIGTDGTIHLNLFHGYAVVESGKVSKANKILRPFDSAARTIAAASFNLARRIARNETAYPGMQKLTERFYQTVRDHAEPPITPAQAINVARIRDYLISRAGAVHQITREG